MKPPPSSYSSSSLDNLKELNGNSKSAIAEVEVKFLGPNVLLKTIPSDSLSGCEDSCCFEGLALEKPPPTPLAASAPAVVEFDFSMKVFRRAKTTTARALVTRKKKTQAHESGLIHQSRLFIQCRSGKESGHVTRGGRRDGRRESGCGYKEPVPYLSSDNKARGCEGVLAELDEGTSGSVGKKVGNRRASKFKKSHPKWVRKKSGKNLTRLESLVGRSHQSGKVPSNPSSFSGKLAVLNGEPSPTNLVIPATSQRSSSSLTPSPSLSLCCLRTSSSF
ncbi:hypothetical protein NE237_021613 [Protea cynaroides]|uniref:Uncharacterized protein n=1 Tax=Protea cynaroides TaxID=273540 RepID=A0A9Q0HBI9_9MAGN|nr:hypothetical protein NE237_021613 [Protea cynaroides]